MNGVIWLTYGGLVCDLLRLTLNEDIKSSS
jgi:hypothetical protein